MNFKLIVISSLLFFLIFYGCENVVEPNDIGWKVEKLHFASELPSYINVMFQVTDMRDSGIANLQASDFMVYEDSMPFSPTESFPVIRKRENIPYTLKTVLLLDNSLSVGDNLDEIKSAAVTLINNISRKQEFAIYKFSETTELIIDFTRDVPALTEAINSIELGGPTTNLYGAIITGVERWTDYYSLDSIQQGFMIALTDGSDTQHSHTLEEALDAREERRIYTIGLGPEIDPSVLNELGNVGNFVIDDVSDVVEKFNEIQHKIISWANSFYWLNYMSPTRGDLEHTFKLAIVDNENRRSTGYIEEIFSSNGFFSVEYGLYINATSDIPYGISSFEIKSDSTITLEATTYLPPNLPQYIWHSTDETVVAIEENDNDNSYAYLTAVGLISDTASIFIKDTANDLYDTVHVKIISN